MKNTQIPGHVSLSTLLDRLKDGRYVIPDFQREFEWEPWDIRDLVRSIFLDYYIGSLLLWKGTKDNFEALSCQPIYGFSGDEDRQNIVLDGQQRLTALYYAFVGPSVDLPRRQSPAIYYVKVDQFMNEQYDDAFHYDFVTRRLSKLLTDLEAQYAEHFFPCSIVGAGGWDLGNWVQGYERFWKDRAKEAASSEDEGSATDALEHVEHAKAFSKLLKQMTDQYQISFIELSEELEIDKVCDIFTQLNSKGVRLDVFDLMNALLRPKGLKLKEMWWASESRLTFVNSPKMNVYVLQVMSILRQGYCSPKYLYFLLPNQPKPVRDPDGKRRKEILIPSTVDFERRWKQAVTALEDASKLLRHPQEFGAVSAKYVPYVSILPVFSALQAHVKSGPADLRFGAQRKIRHWYWASVFTNRYSGAVESTSTRDFLDVCKWIEDDEKEPALIQEFASRFRRLELRKEINSGSSVYNGVFNLLVLGGARDWLANTIPQFDDLDDHHIVPVSWGAAHLERNVVHTILNRTPLTADTNRHVINDQLPNAYLPRLIEKNGEKAVKEMLESHFISTNAMTILLRNPFTAVDFEEFISERQRTVQAAIEDLLIKERIDLPPNLRELDSDVESIELKLRRAISEALGGDPKQLPGGVQQKVNERIQNIERRDAAFDAEHYKTLDGKLEYCDLRELQSTIVEKPIWPLFESRFASKEMLNTRFGQLAGVRNALRHSRTVDEITRKEGEAAIIWFGQVLSKQV